MHEIKPSNLCGKLMIMNKNNLIKENLPWAISEEEFRNSGNFEHWTSKTVKEAIKTLMEITIIAYHFQPKNKIQ